MTIFVEITSSSHFESAGPSVFTAALGFFSKKSIFLLSSFRSSGVITLSCLDGAVLALAFEGGCLAALVFD